LVRGEGLDIYEYHLGLLPIIYPRFRSVFTKNGKELILLIEDSSNIKDFSDVEVENCTECEAIENHVHLFDEVGENNRKRVTTIGTAIAENLLKCLTKDFPGKKFIVFLDINVHDSVVIRFHQARENEPPYFNVIEWENILEFKNY